MRHARRETTESSSERVSESISCCSVGLMFLGNETLPYEVIAMSNIIKYDFEARMAVHTKRPGQIPMIYPSAAA